MPIYNKKFFSKITFSLSLVLITSFLVIPVSCYASDNNHAFQFWPTFFFTGPITAARDIKYNLIINGRFSNKQPYLERGITRFGLGYQHKHLSYWFGVYASHKANNDANELESEYRLWQDVIWNLIENRHHSISLRTRFEERKNEDSAQWALRIREKFRINFPAIGNKYTPVLWNELFFNVNHPDWVSNKTLSQNRLFLGVSVPYTQRIRIDVGYLNQYAFSSSNSMNHILYLQFTFLGDAAIAK